MNEMAKRAQKALDVIDGETELREIYYKNEDDIGTPAEVNMFDNNYISDEDIEAAFYDATLACEKVGFYYGFRAAVKLIKSLDLFDGEVSK